MDIYILHVKDNDDYYCYDTFVYDNEKDYLKAKEIIEKVNNYWYSDECRTDAEAQNIGFYEFMYGKLHENNLLGLKTKTATVLVR